MNTKSHGPNESENKMINPEPDTYFLGQDTTSLNDKYYDEFSGCQHYPEQQFNPNTKTTLTQTKRLGKSHETHNLVIKSDKMPENTENDAVDKETSLVVAVVADTASFKED